jgi:hypothetical protein
VPEVPQVPEGMMLVTRPDGSPWFHVGARPVTHGEYVGLFPNHKVARASSPDQPVTGVSYDYAQAYASARQGRMLTAEEWEAAVQVAGFELGQGLWEWVRDDTGAGKRPVRSGEGAAEREARGGKDVTFRLAADLERKD